MYTLRIAILVTLFLSVASGAGRIPAAAGPAPAANPMDSSHASPTQIPRGSAILLEVATIDTTGPAEKARRSGKPEDKITGDISNTAQELTARKTLPFIVQFAGPIRDEWKTELARTGGTIRGYLPDYAFVVELSPERLTTIAALPSVRWIGEFYPEYKMQRSIRQWASQAGEPEDYPSPARRLVTVQTFAPEDAECVAGRIRALGGEIKGMADGSSHGYIRALLAPEAVPALARLAEVAWLEPYIAPEKCNDVAAQSERLNAQPAWTNGLTGRGQVVGHADTGIDIGVNNSTLHPDFTNRVRAAYGLGRPGDWSDPDGHGTHTAGSILGNGSASGGQFKGIAYEAELVHQSLEESGGGFFLPADLNDLYNQTYTNGARLHSDSWGIPYKSGQYSTEAQQSDEFMWNHKDMLLVFAAGNEGEDDNEDGVVDLDAVRPPGTSKNVLTVGATENKRPAGSGGYSSMTYGNLWWYDYPVNPIHDDLISTSDDGVHQGMAAFSSRGPTDDGRSKPDVIAPGTDVISCRSHESGAGTAWGAYDANYVFSGGTSMSCPLVAGAAAVVRQYYADYQGIPNPSAALVKATLVNGARSLSPGQYGWSTYREIPFRPSVVEGWGQVDLGNTLFPAGGGRVLAYDNQAFMTPQRVNTYDVTVTGEHKLCVTLAWTDYPGETYAMTELVNDLDIIVISPDGSTNYPNGLVHPDRLNNLEGIDIDPAETGAYTIVVSGYNIPQSPQPYALVIREAQRYAGPRPCVTPADVVIFAPEGESNTVDVVVSNAGSANLEYAITLDTGAYDWEDSDDPGGPTYAWIDISTNGTSVALSDDGETGLLPIGFSFPFYDSAYSQFIIGANGGIAFAVGNVPLGNTQLPTSPSGPGPFVAPFWDDLDPSEGGSIYYHSDGSRLVVSWVAVPRYRWGGGGAEETFQVILEDGGDIVFQYENMNGTVNSATIGIQENNTPARATQIAYNTTYVKNSLATRLTPIGGNWLTVAPTGGTIAAGAAATLHFTGDASGKTGGTYSTTVTMTHNGYGSSVDIPVDLVVPEPGMVFALFIVLVRFR